VSGLLGDRLIIVSHQHFGTLPEGTPIDLYTLKSGKLEVQLMTYGASLVTLRIPDRAGIPGDVVLGFPNLAGYVENHRSEAPVFFGSTIGRYGNRIANARFSLDGVQYTLTKNNGDHSLHGGPGGFHNVVWSAELFENGVAFSYLSKDGEEGFPGNLRVTVRYTLLDPDLKIEYLATSDKPTVLSLANHSYFSLAGAARGDILDHRLKIFASRFTPVDAGLIPTGETFPVAETPFDFRQARAIGHLIDSDDIQIRFGHGYDHNFVLDNSSSKLKEAAGLYDSLTGRAMQVWTTEPAIQFYRGNFLDGRIKSKIGSVYPITPSSASIRRSPATSLAKGLSRTKEHS
jgi:aldose 1-epimerase